MKIVVTGTHGYIAGNLVRRLEAGHHEIIAISRGTLYDIPHLTEKLSGADAVIHLAGASILRKWTPGNKAQILQSRTVSTQNVVRAINGLSETQRPGVFISASAVGIYQAGLSHTETSTIFAGDFVGEVAKSWEKSSDELDKSVRKVIFRTGVVLGKESKTILNMLPVFKLGLGGRIGSGLQPFPFVHIKDVVRAMCWALQNAEVHGIYNLVAPQNITNGQFTVEMAKLLHRPAFFVVPELVLKAVYGEAASLLLRSPTVYPERLLGYGFHFEYPEIRSVLTEIIRK